MIPVGIHCTQNNVILFSFAFQIASNLKKKRIVAHQNDQFSQLHIQNCQNEMENLFLFKPFSVSTAICRLFTCFCSKSCSYQKKKHKRLSRVAVRRKTNANNEREWHHSEEKKKKHNNSWVDFYRFSFVC